MSDVTEHAVTFVGLTGGLGSGKSTALRLLGELGCATISADAIVHDLYRGEALRDLVFDRWGSGILAIDGSIDRSAVAERAFADPAEREWLQEQIWPLVGQAIWAFRLAADAIARGEAPDPDHAPLIRSAHLPPTPRAAVVETPLLFEAGMAPLYDTTVAVIAPEDVRAARAAARGHAAVDERAAAQLPQEEKAALADHTVTNDGTEDALRDKLAALVDAISEPVEAQP